jgi:hypothetical protein
MDSLQRVGGHLEPHRRPSGRRAVLLPVEVNLCEQLGITADEYWDFIANAQDAVKERPEEYSHIPDVRNDAVTLFVVNLVVGIALTAVSALLAPKPKQPTQKKQLAQLDIDGSQGRSRYTKSSNFDSVQSLAELGETIPLVFADRDTNSGGIRIDSQLLYSQMITAGTTQTLLAVMMLGAGRFGGTPEYAGYAIGDLMLRDFSTYKNQLFFSAGLAQGNRLKDGVGAGNQYEEGKLQITSDGDAFSPYNPARGKGKFYPDFSGTRTPSSQTRFGLYNPMPNGHKFFVPYELVTYATGDGANRDTREDSKAKIEKMMKDFPRTAGCIANNDRETTYRVSSYRLDTDEEAFRPWGLSDVLQSQDEVRAMVDETIQEGQEYMLNQARAICIRRPDEGWAPELKNDLDYVFYRPPGLPGSEQIIVTSDASDLGKGRKEDSLASPWQRGCVQQLAVATLSNSRPCNSTQIGIRSEVWRQIQGAANFNAHPDYDTIEKYQEENSGISLGQVTKYMKRYSFFRVYARKLGASNWLDISGSRTFAVKGVTPEYLFNTLHVAHEEGQHEYQIVPVPGAAFYQKIRNDGIDIHLLDGRPLTKGKFAENTTGLNNGYEIFYTGTTSVITISTATNREWVFSYKDQNTGGDTDGGPITGLESYSDGNPIPTSENSGISKDIAFVQPIETRSMVKIDPSTLIRTFWYEGQIRGTSNNPIDFIDVKGGGDRDLRFRLVSQDDRPTGDRNELIPAGWGDTTTEYDMVSTVGAPRYTFGIVKIGDQYRYYWNSILVLVTTQNTNDYLFGEGVLRRYKKGNAVNAGGTSLELLPEFEDRFNGGQRVTDGNGNSQFSTVDVGVLVNTATGQNDFYKGGNYLGSATTVRLDLGNNLTYKRDSRKQDAQAAFTKVLESTSREIDTSKTAISNAMERGAIRRNNNRPNEYQVWENNTFLGTCGAGETVRGFGVDWLVDTRYNDNYNIGGTVYFCCNIRKQQSIPAIPELWSHSIYERVEAAPTWEITRQMAEEGQEGKYYIEKLEMNVNAPVLAEVSTRRLVDGDNRTATARVEYYKSDSTQPDAYRWSIAKKGDGYRLNNKVDIAGTGIKVKITNIQEGEGGIDEVDFPDTIKTEERFQAFIAPGTNYSPLNAICDYFINNTDSSSHDNGPEHTVVFCNELIDQFPSSSSEFVDNPVPQYEDLAVAGIKLLNAKEWTSFNSLSAYIQRGLMVEHLFTGNRPSSGQSEGGKTIGSTHYFPEIAYYMLTDEKFGAGKLVGSQAVNREAMAESAKFCAANGFYWDGIVASNQNLREFIFQNAAFMLLDFTIKGGKFALIPSVPYNSSTYLIEQGTAPQIKALFTDGIMRNMTISFLSPEERQPFIGVCLFRSEVKNGFPVTRTMTMRLAQGSESDPVEEFDCTAFMTSEGHARQFLRYALKTREIIDHGIKFETTPQAAMNLEPGEYFRVASKTTHTDRFQSGSIDFEGNITSSQEFGDNVDTTVVYWRPGEVGVSSSTNMSIRNSKVTNTNLFGTLFCKTSSTQETRCYKCESLTYGSDGLVEVAGSVAPLTNSGALQILDWTENDSDFVEETF